MSSYGEQRRPQRENFFTLRAMEEKIKRESERMSEISITRRESQEPKRSYATAHTEETDEVELVGSPTDGRCRYFTYE